MKILTWTDRRIWIINAIFIASLILLFNIKSGNLKWPDWTGFGEEITISKSTETKVDEGTKTTTTEHFQSGKTLWDWLSVLIIPFSLAAIGFGFQQLQQKRSDQQAALEKEIANINLREESLQVYFDRLSELLLDKQLINNIEADNFARGVAFDIIRARTLSIFRRLDKDGERKSSVIQFLYDAELITKWGLNIKDADLADAILSDANLSGANLVGSRLYNARLFRVNLHGANLCNADLDSANLTQANLRAANLSNTNLAYADLSEADLRGADLRYARLSYSIPYDEEIDTKFSPAILRGANLSSSNLSQTTLISVDLSDVDLAGANLSEANLYNSDLSKVKSWTEEQLGSAKLCQTKLPEGCSLDPDRDCRVLRESENYVDE